MEEVEKDLNSSEEKDKDVETSVQSEEQINQVIDEKMEINVGDTEIDRGEVEGVTDETMDSEQLLQGTGIEHGSEAEKVAEELEGRDLGPMEVENVGGTLMESGNFLITEEEDPTTSIEEQLHELEGDMDSSTISGTEPSTSFAQQSTTFSVPKETDLQAAKDVASELLQSDDHLGLSDTPGESMDIQLDAEKTTSHESDSVINPEQDHGTESRLDVENYPQIEGHVDPQLQAENEPGTEGENTCLEGESAIHQLESIDDLQQDTEDKQSVVASDLQTDPESVSLLGVVGGFQAEPESGPLLGLVEDLQEEPEKEPLLCVAGNLPQPESGSLSAVVSDLKSVSEAGPQQEAKDIEGGDRLEAEDFIKTVIEGDSLRAEDLAEPEPEGEHSADFQPEDEDVPDQPEADATLPVETLESLANLKQVAGTPCIYFASKQDIDKALLKGTQNKLATNKSIVYGAVTKPTELRPEISKVSQTPLSEPSTSKQYGQRPSLQKKDIPGTDDLSTLANAALTCDQASGSIVKASRPEEPKKKEPVWADVGVIKGTSCHVSFYHVPSPNHDPEHESITIDKLPDYSNCMKINLESGTAYKFRVCAINSCGRSPWSEVSAFKTSLPGYPGAPSAIKISKSSEGAHLSWEPPSNPAGKIVEYLVCLAVKTVGPQIPTADGKGQQLCFVRVYNGPYNSTVVPNQSLATAHLDKSSKPAIIFRISAKNEKGFGPATQVRWLQDVVAAPAAPAKQLLKKDPPGVPIKRPKLDEF